VSKGKDEGPHGAMGVMDKKSPAVLEMKRGAQVCDVWVCMGMYGYEYETVGEVYSI
jgi:hypothetical protein